MDPLRKPAGGRFVRHEFCTTLFPVAPFCYLTCGRVADRPSYCFRRVVGIEPRLRQPFEQMPRNTMNILVSIARGLRLALVVVVLVACAETPEGLVKSAKDYIA